MADASGAGASGRRAVAASASRRLRRHLSLALIAAALVLGAHALLGYSPEPWRDVPDLKAEDGVWRLSVASAYAALCLLAAALTVGPLRALRGLSNPVSIGLRRDLGIWAGSLALLHLALGLLVHARQPALAPLSEVIAGLFSADGVPARVSFLQLFLAHWPDPSHGWHAVHLRANQLALGIYLGITQASLLILLLTTSNNLSLRTLGARRWKRLHRLVYLVWLLVGLHALTLQDLEGRHLSIRLVFGAIFALVVALQIAGFVARRRQGGR